MLPIFLCFIPPYPLLLSSPICQMNTTNAFSSTPTRFAKGSISHRPQGRCCAASTSGGGIDTPRIGPGVIHSAPMVGSKIRRCLSLLANGTKDDRDGFGVVVEFLPGNGSREVIHFERDVAPRHHDIQAFFQVWLHVRPDPSLMLVRGVKEDWCWHWLSLKIAERVEVNENGGRSCSRR